MIASYFLADHNVSSAHSDTIWKAINIYLKVIRIYQSE